MSLQITTDLKIDFYDKKYILINAKQLDRKSRFISVSCYNHGNLVPIDFNEHSAYIRYRKSDGNGVFNECKIDEAGKIIVELTEQMLSSDGVCCADFVIVNKGDAKIDVETGDILYINDASILSSMLFYIDTSEVAVNNYEIESSYEYNGLNTAIEKVEAEYKEVIQLAKSYAVGNADGIRENEDADNAKYYYQQSSIKANSASASASAASTSENIAKSYMQDALDYKNDSYTYMTSTETYMNNAKTSETNAKTSEANAKTSETNAKASEIAAKTSETNVSSSESKAKTSETNAKTSEANAKTSETNALNSANKAQSYAVGGTGTRTNEDNDNAYYYYNKMVSIINGVESGFIPMGTISFSELATVEKATGYVYNISDDFVTTDDFREGAGKSYTAGVNVYFCADGLWDCFGGASSSSATVDEVKTYLGI